jgi:cell division protease FtsH
MTGTRRLYSEATAREIDVALRKVVDGAFQRARAILAENRALLEESARELLRKETLAGDELAAVLGRVSREHPRVAAAAPV